MERSAKLKKFLKSTANDPQPPRPLPVICSRGKKTTPPRPPFDAVFSSKPSPFRRGWDQSAKFQLEENANDFFESAY
jgi:hypothetical protein